MQSAVSRGAVKVFNNAQGIQVFAFQALNLGRNRTSISGIQIDRAVAIGSDSFDAMNDAMQGSSWSLEGRRWDAAS